MDKAPEMCSLAMLCWAADRGVQLHRIAPGKPVASMSTSCTAILVVQES